MITCNFAHRIPSKYKSVAVKTSVYTRKTIFAYVIFVGTGNLYYYTLYTFSMNTTIFPGKW